MFLIELKKMFKFRPIKISILVIMILMCVCGISCTSLHMTVFEYQIELLNMFGEFFIISFIAALSSYVFGLEISCDTLKIVRAKPISIFKLYMSKFSTAVIYCGLICCLIYIMGLMFGYVFLSKEGIHMTKYNLSYQNSYESMRAVQMIYGRQFIASIFIIAFSLLISVWSQKQFIPILTVPIIVGILDLLDNVKYLKTTLLTSILPLNSDCICRELVNGNGNDRLICLAIYTIILILLGMYIFAKQEIKS
ncbi:ABC-2 family transporter permease [Cellulosilyticum ruminicola]|uniref:ABC transporter permease n=1 Tax=Cellulosilyticum ruminicola TaxID=425254 RepID=UPI0006D23DDB|nr:ABC transporter permease [Cellulosilyticum ruminicola]